METTIEKWIEDPNRDYSDGVSLFGKYGGNRSMLRYFTATQPRFAIKKLLYELGRLAKKHQDIQVVPPMNANSSAVVPIAPLASSVPDKTPENNGNIPEVAGHGQAHSARHLGRTLADP